MNKFIKVILFILIFFLTSVTNIFAVTNEIVNNTIKNSTYQNFLRVLERSVHAQVNYNYNFKISDEMSMNYEEKIGYSIFKPADSSNLYYIKDEITDIDIDNIFSILSEQVENRINLGNWNLLENIYLLYLNENDWLDDPSIIKAISISEASEKQLDDLVFNVLSESNIISAVPKGITTENYKQDLLDIPTSIMFNPWESVQYLEGLSSLKSHFFFDWSDYDDSRENIYDPIPPLADYEIEQGTYLNHMFTFKSGSNQSFYSDDVDSISINFIHNWNWNFYLQLIYERGSNLFMISSEHLDSEEAYNQKAYINGVRVSNNELMIGGYNLGFFNITEEQAHSLTNIIIYFPKNNNKYAVEFELNDDIYRVEWINDTPNKYLGNKLFSRVNFETWPEETRSNINADLETNIYNLNLIENEQFPRPKKDDIEIGSSSHKFNNTIYIPSPNINLITDSKGNEYSFQKGENGYITLVNNDEEFPLNDKPIINPANNIPNPDPDISPIPEQPIVDDPLDENEPYPPGNICKELDLQVESINIFTEKFPFSLPWDVYRAINSVFGGMGSEVPSWELPIGDEIIEIVLPNFIKNSIPFIKAMLILSFDIGLIYALRKWFGGVR